MAVANTTTTLKTKSAKAKKESDMRLKHAQRAAILLKQVSDPTRLQVVEQGQKNWLGQPFWRDIQQLETTCQQVFLKLPVFMAGKGGVEVRGGHATTAQGRHLVLHQGNERRYHQGDSGQQQCRNLVAQ